MDLTDIPDNVRAPDEEPPDFDDLEDPEELLTDQPTRERMFDVIVQLRDPTKVSEIADMVECDTETARDYLHWFTEMGMVREYTGRPTRYERNESYLQWRRIEAIRSDYTDEEIVAELTATLEDLESYRERFDAGSPGAVSLVDASREHAIEDAWEALSEWQTLERRAALLDAARRKGTALSGDVERMDA